MKWDEIFCHSFKAIRQQHEAEIEEAVSFMLPSMPMIKACRADHFDYFDPFIAAGKLTIEQMHHAAQRYFLGKTKSGQPIYWMIDEMMTPLDAHIGDTWISRLLKQRHPILESWSVKHCLFGLHLLYDIYLGIDERLVCIVESEASAVVLSELLPENIWMAYGTNAHLLIEQMAPLKGRTVIFFPNTDPAMSNYDSFQEFANIVRRSYDIDIQIDTTLEDHATAAQKERNIDLLDFLLDSLQ